MADVGRARVGGRHPAGSRLGSQLHAGEDGGDVRITIRQIVEGRDTD
jgi:hypothetical protein